MILTKMDMYLVLAAGLQVVNFTADITFDSSSPILVYGENITARTMFSEILDIADEALLGSLGDLPENACAYQQKIGSIYVN